MICKMGDTKPNSFIIEKMLKELEGIKTDSTIEIDMREMDDLASMFMKKPGPFYCIRAIEHVDGEIQSKYDGYVVEKHDAWEISYTLNCYLNEKGIDTVGYEFRNYPSPN